MCEFSLLLVPPRRQNFQQFLKCALTPQTDSAIHARVLRNRRDHSMRGVATHASRWL
jgi:hypothetical protein